MFKNGDNRELNHSEDPSIWVPEQICPRLQPETSTAQHAALNERTHRPHPRPQPAKSHSPDARTKIGHLSLSYRIFLQYVVFFQIGTGPSRISHF